MNMRRFSYEQLIAYAAGEMPPEEAGQVEAFLRQDAQAAKTVAAYRLVQKRLAGDDSMAPPEETLAEAKRIFMPARSAESASGPGWLERLDAVIARLLFDSRLQPVAVRRSLPGRSIHLSYRSDSVELDLTAERQEAGSRWRLTGQLSTESGGVEAPLAIVESDTGKVVFEDTSDEDGYFDLTVPAGRFDICVNLGQSVFVAPELEIE